MTHPTAKHKTTSGAVAPGRGLGRSMFRPWSIWCIAGSLVCLSCSCDEESPAAHIDQRAKPDPIPAPATKPSPTSADAFASRCPVMKSRPQPSRIEAEYLSEVSGVVASRDFPGLFWAHNDSGDSAKLYALDSSGQHVGTVRLDVEADDWEDIALLSREGPDAIFVADTGDNFSQRRDGVVIHRISEPDRTALIQAHPSPLRLEAESMRLSYPEGPEDVEALVADPLSGELTLISKPRLAAPNVYTTRFEDHSVAEFKGTITEASAGHILAMVTAADISADGRWVVVRTYTGITLFQRKRGQSVAQAILTRGCPLGGPPELQGESIAFLPMPSKEDQLPLPLVTVSEGSQRPINRFEFVPSDAEKPVPLR